VKGGVESLFNHMVEICRVGGIVNH
jgi:hypothetical protein